MCSFKQYPDLIHVPEFRYWRRTLGLQVRYADCGGYRFCYSYRGKPGMRPSILMLHGFSAHKDMWLTVVKVVDVSGATVIAELVPGCRVDLLDNCGHSVVMEKPCRTAKLILDFIILQQNARSGTKKSS
ncbi:hypothetical protein XENOCAPTIV_005610 [Xenoophorus captivus]|uniref:acylglycerol lipase n=1 Tax=Xenoophorus captivus TaxID=1517983 RepID=A0ABV0S2R8_9TELE